MNLLFICAIYFSLLACVLNYSRLQPSYLKYFSWFLLFTAVGETIAYYMMSRNLTNHWLYNLLILVEVTFINFIYHQALRPERFKSIIRVFSLLYILVFIVNAVFVQGWQTLNTYTYVIGGLGVLSWIGMYFLQLLQYPHFPELKKQPLFWISAGLLLYYIGNTPFYGMINYLITNHIEVARNLFLIVHVLLVFKYSLLGVGFLCIRTNQK